MSIQRLDRVLSFILILVLSSVIVSAYSDLEIRGSYDVGENVKEIYVEDIDNDHSLDIVVVVLTDDVGKDDLIYVLDSNARLKWKYSIKDLQSVFISDIDNNGFKEVLISFGRMENYIEKGNIYVLNKDGKVIFGYPRDMKSSHFVFYDLCAIDTNDNGYQEIIFGSSKGVSALKDTYDGFIWNFRTNETITGLMLKDIEGGGNEEIIASSFSNLYVLDLNGTKRWNYSMTEGIKKINIGDLSPTEGNELLLVSKRDMIHILTNKFEVILNTRIIDNIIEVSTLDMNRDGFDEIILGSKNGVYILNNRFMVKNKYETREDVHGIYLTDWDKDRENEIIFGSGSYVYIITTEGKLKYKYHTGQKIDIFIHKDLNYNGYPDLIINSGSNVSIFEKKESMVEDKAKESYEKAKSYFERGNYDDALKYIDEAIKQYKEIEASDDVIEICESLKKEIKLKIVEKKKESADLNYKIAEEYFLNQDYENARRELDKATQSYLEINDQDGILKCSALSSKIDEKIEGKEKDILSMIGISKEGINPFLIFSIVLLIIIVILMVSLLLKRK